MFSTTSKLLIKNTLQWMLLYKAKGESQYLFYNLLACIIRHNILFYIRAQVEDR